MWIKFLFVSTPAFDFIIFNGVCFCMWLDYVHILTSQNKLTLQNPSCYKTVTFSVTEPKQYLTWQNQMSQITNGSAGEMTTDQSKPRIMDKGITHIFQLSFRVTRVAWVIFDCRIYLCSLVHKKYNAELEGVPLPIKWRLLYF